MYRPPKNCAVYLVLISLLQGWELNLVVVVEVKVDTGEEVIIIIIKEFVVRIYTLELNLFGLVACVFYYRVCRWESKLIAAYLTTL